MTSEKLRILLETEHQELWYPEADLSRPLDVHIPSALGTIGYYVCVRVPAEYADRLGGVVVRAKIGGLRPDDLTLKAGEGMKAADRLPCRTPGYLWRLLCRAYMSRGDGTIEFAGWPAELARTDVLLCTWPRYIESGQADDWLECRKDPAWSPGGIPLGGIGCGKVELCRDGRFRNFTANNNQDMPLEDPAGLKGACLEVLVDGKTRRALRSEANGKGPKIEFSGRFPQAKLSVDNLVPGVDVSVLASGMVCPHDLRRSSMPGMIVRWTVANRGKKPRDVCCMMSWPNLIGIGGGMAEEETDIGRGDGSYAYWEDTDGRTEEVVDTPRLKGVRFAGSAHPRRLASSGTHLLAVRGGPAAEAQAGDGKGTVGVSLEVPAGGTATADMALVWAMPHWVDSKGVDRGHLWQRFFSTDEEMAGIILDEADDILSQAGSLARLLDASTLPDWLKSRLSNCNYPLVTNSVLYRDGRFSVNEGPTEMVACYGTIDQRLGAHPAAQLFFPGLNEQELTEFAAIQSPNGGINHDLGHGHLENPAREQAWPDIPCSFIIQCARHAWSTGDAAFETAMWPRARQALLRGAVWADEGGGVAQSGKGIGTSYDGYHYFGTTPYLGTLWLAALSVIEVWALKRGDRELLPRIAEWRRKALERMETDLWNGCYYRTYGSPGGPVRETSFAGQAAGQVFSRMLAGTDVLPEDRLAGCVEAIMSLNAAPKFPVPPDEATPEGEAAVEFGWLPYVEAFGLTAAATRGDPRVMEVWERMIRSVHQDGTRLCDTRLMYRPTTGEPSWGAYYMTAPASWLVYEALLDFFYARADGVLRLNPRLEGVLPLVHPLWWGRATVRGGSVKVEIDQVFDEVRSAC